SFDTGLEKRDLFDAPMTEQSEMHVDAMQRLAPAGNGYLAMEQAAAFRVMHRDILVVPPDDGVLAEDGVAVIATVIDCIPAVGKIFPYRIGQELVLRVCGPVVVALGVAFVQSLYLLQEY